ncbi:hypothetical protein [Empedobacter sp.]|uniref:hypothetical protein n=1 Tax=Empedobacter sp. TaxID=1927715 RepID=UPI00289D3888|nr:hypothetical protein [Empedobacter sp.]
MVKNYTDSQLLNRVKKLKNFIKIPENYWILGVRSKEDRFNEFDDKFYLFKGEQFIMVMSGTTNPGANGLLNPEKYNERGIAVVVADKWYYNLWTRGLHNGKVIAYRQTAGVDLIRDRNKNKKSGDAGSVSEEFNRGINFHPSDYNLDSKTKKVNIGAWSVGCQVVNDIPKYKELMNLTRLQQVMSYCLINEF